MPYADAYRRLRDCDYVAARGARDVNLSLRRLHQVDNNDWRPPALWALHQRSDDPDWLARFLRALERLAASMLIRRAYATPRATRYAAVLRALENGDGLEADALELTADEKAETLSRLQGEVYQVNAVRKFVLLRLDEVLANNPGVVYDRKIITIEHVLPQTPAPLARRLLRRRARILDPSTCEPGLAESITQLGGPELRVRPEEERILHLW